MASFADAFALHEKEPSVATSLLLGLISEASNGRDITSAVSELVVVRGSGVGSKGVNSNRAKILQREDRPLYRLTYIQAVFGRPNVHPSIKKLAYEMCKCAHLSDPECEFITRAIKVRRWGDITGILEPMRRKATVMRPSIIAWPYLDGS